MNIATLSVLSLLPIITVAVFLVVLRWPASRAMPLSYGVSIVLALAVWQVPVVQVVAASINGLIVALTLLTFMRRSYPEVRRHPLCAAAAVEWRRPA